MTLLFNMFKISLKFVKPDGVVWSKSTFKLEQMKCEIVHIFKARNIIGNHKQQRLSSVCPRPIVRLIFMTGCITFLSIQQNSWMRCIENDDFYPPDAFNAVERKTQPQQQRQLGMWLNTFSCCHRKFIADKINFLCLLLPLQEKTKKQNCS